MERHKTFAKKEYLALTAVLAVVAVASIGIICVARAAEIGLIPMVSSHPVALPYANQKYDFGVEITDAHSSVTSGRNHLEITLTNIGESNAIDVSVNALFPQGATNIESPNVCTKTEMCEIAVGEDVILTYDYAGADATKDVIFSVRYRYGSHSSLNITIISEELWRNMTRDGTFSSLRVRCESSSSPALLSVGSFDQPLVSKRPFYLGLNLSTGRSNLTLDESSVQMELPERLGSPDRCLPALNPDMGYSWKEWEFGKPIYCIYTQTPALASPSETFEVQAKASYTVIANLTVDDIILIRQQDTNYYWIIIPVVISIVLVAVFLSKHHII